MVEGRNYINGQFAPRRFTGEFDNINPANGEVIGKFPQTHPEDIRFTYQKTRKAFNSWKNVSRLQRAEYLDKVATLVKKNKNELAKIISKETGKNYNESIAEVNEALHMAQFAFGSGRTPTGEIVASELAEKDSYMIRKPKGVVAIISPFNFPVAIGAFWCAAPALVEGNTVIIKPSEDAPWSTHFCAKLYHEAGIPEGVFNVIHGDGKVGDALVHEDVDHVCFTGSAEVGQHIRKVCAESWHKTCSCEMGSKSACIVFNDADLDMAVDACIASAFKLSGQRCVSSSRMIVQFGIYEEFCKRFVEKAKELKTGDPFVTKHGTCGTPACIGITSEQPNPDMYYGPLINEASFTKVRYYNDLVFKDEHASVLLSPVYTGKDNARYSTPMIYTAKWRDKEFLKKEVFGPHVAIVPFDTVEEGVDIYNDTEFGLAVGILTNSYRTARYCRDNCDAGMIYHNGGSIAAESHLPFGGVKKSGNGFPTAAKMWEAVTHTISWTVNHGEEIAFPQGMNK